MYVDGKADTRDTMDNIQHVHAAPISSIVSGKYNSPISTKHGLREVRWQVAEALEWVRKRIFSSPLVQSTSPVHQSSPVIVYRQNFAFKLSSDNSYYTALLATMTAFIIIYYSYLFGVSSCYYSLWELYI